MCRWESRELTLYSLSMTMKMRIAGLLSPAIYFKVHQSIRKKRRRKKKLTVMSKFPYTMAPLICKSNSGMWTRNAIWLVSSANCTGVSLKTVTQWCKTIKITTFTRNTWTSNSYSTREKKIKSLLSRQEINSLQHPKRSKCQASRPLR